MNINRLVILGGLLLSGWSGVASAETSQPIVKPQYDLAPVELQPYQPFTIEIEYAPYYQSNAMFFTNIANNTIQIFHQLSDGFMGQYGSILSVEIQGLPPGSYDVRSLNIVGHDLERVPYLHLERQEAVIISAAPPAQRVYSFFHPEINHYFMTASQEEAQLITGQGLGWRIVDPGFNVWPAEGPAPAAALPVCRFYSYDVNSHFYTADAAECAELQETQDSWQYEGIAFRALVPTAETCPTGTTPVWRLYNNRFAEMDSNHRFVASSETYRTMIARGWVGEGVAFCSPPDSN